MAEHKIAGTPEIHRRFFPEFIKYERLGGGPDPHVKLANWIARNDPRITDRLWWFGCYITPYVVSSGEVIYHNWPTSEEVLANQEGFMRWMRDNYAKLQIRKERRAIYGAERFGRTMIEYAKWAQLPMPNASFDACWTHCTAIPGFGRYAATKLYEVLYQDKLIVFPFPDIRPSGGKTPRLMLAWLRPEEADVLDGDDRATTIASVNQVAAEEKAWLLNEKGLDVDWFELEVTLCEYKQAYLGGQYPGRSHDSELGRSLKVQERYPELPLMVWVARKTLFPWQVLGEVGDRWAGRRGLGVTVAEHGYTWSDMLYDYTLTTDLAQPGRREDAPAN